MLEYDRIDVSEVIDVNKANASKEYVICHYRFYLWTISLQWWSWFNEKTTYYNDVAIASVKGSDYRIHFWYISKYDTINTMKIADLNDKSGLL